MLNRYFLQFVLISTPVSVLASGMDTVFSVNLSQEYSDNVFKLDPDNALYSLVESADVITQTGAGLSLSKTISRQKMTVQVNFLQNNYQNNTQLDNQSNTLETDWAWAVGSKARGNMGYNQVEQLKDFEDQIGIEKNTERSGVLYFKGQLDLSSQVSLNVDLESISKRNQLDSKKEFDRDEYSRAVYLGYNPSQRIGYVVGHIHTEGEPSSSIANLASPYDFSQDKFYFGVNYFSGAKTKVGLSAGVVERKISDGRRVDANDLTLDWLWLVTSKSSFDLNLSKRLSSPSSESVAYTESNVVDVVFTHKLSPKTGLSLSYKLEDRVSDLVNSSQNLDEIFKSLGLSFSYRIKPYLGVVLNLKDLGRVSSAVQSDYDVQTVYLGMNLTL